MAIHIHIQNGLYLNSNTGHYCNIAAQDLSVGRSQTPYLQYLLRALKCAFLCLSSPPPAPAVRDHLSSVPPTPGHVTVTANSSSSVVLRWSRPAFLAGKPLRFTVRCTPVGTHNASAIRYLQT